MSRCDIEINFDRDNRTYRGGETVSGEVYVRVNKDTTSKGIRLTRFWSTHGYGNTDRGDETALQLAGNSRLKAGEQMTFPFSFAADCQPITYRGHHINIDHYVKVHVDVPWARDPTVEEEYLLHVGDRPPEVTDDRDEIIDLAPDSSPTRPGPSKEFLVVVSLILIPLIIYIVGGVVLTVDGGPHILWLIPIFALIWLPGLIRKKLLAARLGNVELQTPHRVIGDGDNLPLELRFTPKKDCLVNSIQLEVRCDESATSGSGTNTTTRHHNIYSKVYHLEGANRLTRGMEFHKQFSVTFPKTAAYSLDAPYNKIAWTIAVHIDIPLFPDWKTKQEIQVLPNEFLKHIGPSAGQSVPYSEQDARVPADGQASSEPAADEHSSRPKDSEENKVPSVAEAPIPGVVMLIKQLTDAGRFGDERDRILAAAAEREIELVVNVQRVSSTYDSTLPESCQRGHTVTGTLPGTDLEIDVVTPDDAALDELSRGDRWQTRAIAVKWNALYNRLVMLSVSMN
ncbi:MAG: hypothetical protein VX346_06695 [Planctomycetota bacterium]|nr:hypothetical protein [Planctomycetota bacterium]